MKLEKRSLLSWSNIPLMCILVLGAATTIFGLYRTIKTIVDGDECSSGKDPYFCFEDGFPLNASMFSNNTIGP
ncbi:hypothetical protein LSH36_1651g00015 [Paralvinella palmiformis]|uniref:Transmembrane protein n=1 Tax=Paralvinella palmiformis TaxID=53620 RepID=A0AAD9IS79_9ANNE|nr:hypothetical protein LSH36_1651g00015 [Paralvinella palmiformis]